ncbi:hypothetical protein CHS0354_032633 [Potamilus streckersoni]|uniref:ABC transmembrane type-1 domain-containing protein n=1 Tax=Potamilus streckersoni TaxID=2493646 RepID=A0AAE0SF62_9BIVA|nr:hypothetical protein CHS0354_032633 [Potamilus streckersoni]
MCKTCSAVHRNQKCSRNHVIICVDEILSNPQHAMKIAKGFSCPEHEGEAIDFYCQEHKAASCSKCCIVSQRNCASVSDLKKELPNLLHEMNPDSVIEDMKKLETHLKNITEVNESNISLIESQENDLTSKIRDLRKKINDVLDKLKTKVKMEGHRICKEEEDDITTNFIPGTDPTKVCKDRDYYSPIESESPGRVHTVSRPRKFGKYNKQKRTPMDACSRYQDFAQKRPGSDGIIEIKDKDESIPNYTGIVHLYSGHVMLTDYNNDKVCLLNSTDNSMTTYQMPCGPCEICVVNDTDVVAVTLPFLNTVQFLSVTNGKITPTKKITTRYRYDGIAAAGKGKIIVSGGNAEEGKCYWSLISSEGKGKFFHQVDCQCDPSYTYVALNSSFTRVYITFDMANNLYCFDISVSQKFVYNHASLDCPCGVATDRYDNVYVVGCGSSNFHQLTPDGAILQIISDAVPDSHMAISIRRDNDEILVTNYSDQIKLYQYRLRIISIIILTVMVLNIIAFIILTVMVLSIIAFIILTVMVLSIIAFIILTVMVLGIIAFIILTVMVLNIIAFIILTVMVLSIIAFIILTVMVLSIIAFIILTVIVLNIIAFIILTVMVFSIIAFIILTVMVFSIIAFIILTVMVLSIIAFIILTVMVLNIIAFIILTVMVLSIIAFIILTVMVFSIIAFIILTVMVFSIIAFIILTVMVLSIIAFIILSDGVEYYCIHHSNSDGVEYNCIHHSDSDGVEYNCIHHSDSNGVEYNCIHHSE